MKYSVSVSVAVCFSTKVRLAELKCWVLDTAARSYQNLGVQQALNASSLWVQTDHTEMTSFARFPTLFRGRKVICKSGIPRTAQDQMAFWMPAASQMGFCLLVLGSLARRAANFSGVT